MNTLNKKLLLFILTIIAVGSIIVGGIIISKRMSGGLDFVSTGKLVYDRDIVGFTSDDKYVTIYDGNSIIVKDRDGDINKNINVPSGKSFVRCDSDLIYLYTPNEREVRILDCRGEDKQTVSVLSTAKRFERFGGKMVFLRDKNGNDSISVQNADKEVDIFQTSDLIIGIKFDETVKNGEFATISRDRENLYSKYVFYDDGIINEYVFEGQVVFGAIRKGSKLYAVTNKGICLDDGGERKVYKIDSVHDFEFTSKGIFIAYSDVVELVSYDLEPVGKYFVGEELYDIFVVDNSIFGYGDRVVAGYIDSDSPIYYSVAYDIMQVKNNGRVFDIWSGNFIEQLKLEPKKEVE